MRAPSRLFVWLSDHPLCSFIALLLGFVLFGAVTLDLIRVLNQNLRFLAEHGWDAVREAGLWQLLALLLQAAVGLMGYLVFKFNEHVLVQRLAFSGSLQPGGPK